MGFRFLGGRTGSGLVAEPRPGLSFSSPQTQEAPSVSMLPTGKHMETPAPSWPERLQKYLHRRTYPRRVALKPRAGYGQRCT